MDLDQSGVVDQYQFIVACADLC